MIRSFFGFTCFPFRNDIEQIFLSRQFQYLQKRFSHFIETQGIALLTGEIGSGKTTFIRYTMNLLNPNSYRFFYLCQTVRGSRSFFRMLSSTLGLIPRFFIEDVTAQVKNELINLSNKQKLNPVLVIDEAQNLSDGVLEEIRLLTNFKMDAKNYLSIILMGHPVLKARLKLSPYAALKQRISFNFHLSGLEQDEIMPYITHHLKLAGKTTSVFTDDAVILLFNYSKGLPRIINTLAYESLYRAALEAKNMVEEKLVEVIIQEWENL